MKIREIPEVRDWPVDPVLVRDAAILTTGYVLCAAHQASGLIDVRYAAQITIRFDVFWAAMTDIDFKVEYVNLPPGAKEAVAQSLPAATGTPYTLSDVASAAPYTTWTSALGAFTANMAGCYVHSKGTGTNESGPTLAKITAVNSATSITVDTALDATGTVANATIQLVQNAQELSMATTGGESVLSAHYLHLDDTGVDRAYCFTLPCPAADFARVYIKGVGTLTDTSVIVDVSRMPAGGV